MDNTLNTSNVEVAKKYRKVFKGFVVSTKNTKTIVVKVERKSKHPLYKKLVITHKKYHAHDEHELAKDGDFVEIIETRPLSALKRFKISRILVKAK